MQGFFTLLVLTLIILAASCGPVKENFKPRRGQKGDSCTVKQTETGAIIQCDNGTSATLYHGEKGAVGNRGKDGNSCTVESDSEKATIYCEDGSIATILNGKDGLNGSNGQDGVDGNNFVVEIIDPCGDNPDKFDELLFKLYNGEIMAYFERGNNRFLTIISPGEYQTTDKQKCIFEVLETGEIIW